MKNRFSKRSHRAPKAILRLPDLDHAKAVVLNSLTCPEAQRGYRHAIDEFVDRYCSEPRLAFNETVVLRYHVHLESRKLAPATVNLRLGAVRRLAYEAADFSVRIWRPPSGQGCEKAGSPTRPLVDRRTKPSPMASARC